MKIAAGAGAGNVYKYIGSAALVKPTGGTTAENDHWLTRLDYSDKSKWQLVNLDESAAEVQAYILNSSVDATGALTLDAHSQQTIDATVFAGSVALSGGIVGVSLSGAGAESENRIATLVQAYIEGDKDGQGVGAGSVGLLADDTSVIHAFTGAVSVAAAFGVVGVSASIGEGIAFNEIDNEVDAYIADVAINHTDSLGVVTTTGVTTTVGAIDVEAHEDAGIHATAGAASAAAALGAVGASLSGAGAFASNLILGSTNAYVDDSALASQTDVTVEAENKSTIEAKILAVSAAIADAAFAGAGLSIGAAIAENSIGGYNANGTRAPETTQAYIKNSTVNAGGALEVTATSTPTIDAIVLAGSVAASGGGFVGIGLSGAGASATNQVVADVHAYINGTDPGSDGIGTVGILADSIALTASDTSGIDAVVGTASVAFGVGLGALGASVAVSLAHNQVDNSVAAYITNASVNGQTVETRSGGDISIEATEGATINALGVAASVAVTLGAAAVSFALAGADVDNVILSKTNAYVDNSVLDSGGNVILTAKDTSTINAMVGGDALAASAGGIAGSVAVGFAVAQNMIGYQANGTENASQVQAYVQDSSISADSGLSLEADDKAMITAEVFAASAALSYGAVAIGAAGAGASTQNRIKTLVKAYIDGTDPDEDGTGAMGIEATSVSLLATDDSTINALTGSAALSATVGAAATAISISVALAKNEIANDVEAYVLDGGTVEATGATGIVIKAMDTAHITSTTVAASASLAGSLLDSVSIAGAGADAFNVIHTKTLAYADSSDLVSAGQIDVEASDDSTIKAQVRTTDAAASGGTVAGAVAIGAATAENFIGWGTDSTAAATYSTTSNPGSITTNQTVKIASGADAGSVYKYIGSADLTKPAAAGANWLASVDYSDRTKWQLVNLGKNASQVHAYLISSSADAKGTGSVTVNATEKATINADIAALSVSVAVGLVAVAAAGAGVSIQNSVNNSVLAYVDTTSGDGVQAGNSVSVTATDTSMITATANAVSFAASIGDGDAGAISLSFANNTISNDVEAYATSAKITTTSGGLTITATEGATIISTSTASAAAFAALIALSGSGATSDATVITTTRAYADPVELDIAGDVAIDAISTATANSTTTGAALSVGFITVAVVHTDATATVTPTVEARIGGYSDARQALAHGDISVGSTLAASANATASGGSVAAGLGISSGSPNATAIIQPAAAGTPMVTSEVSGGHIVSTGGGITIRTVYNSDTDGKVTNGTGATATAHAAAGGLVAVSGANATATDTPYLDTLVDSDATLSAKNTIAVTANSVSQAAAMADGNAFGLGGQGNSTASATASGTVKARMEGSVVSDVGHGAANLDVKALSADKATSFAQAVAGGLYGGTDNHANATVAPNLDAHIGANAVVDVSGAITIEANDSPEGDATTKGVSDGLAGIGASVSNVTVTPTVVAYIGSGSQIAAGSVDVSAIAKPVTSADQPTYAISAANAGSDTITVSNHGLQTGDTIEVDNGGSLDIGGIVSTFVDTSTPVPNLTVRREFNVIKVDNNTLELGSVFQGAGIDPTHETITFAGPHNFLEGDTVVYQPEGVSAAVAGLTAGHTYFVHVIDTHTIQLVPPLASDPTMADTAVRTFDNTAISGTTFTIANNGFAEGETVTYHAPAPVTFFSGMVNVDHTLANSVESLTDHPGLSNLFFVDADGNAITTGYTAGEVVTYHVSSGTAGVAGTAIGGLIDGQQYRVVLNADGSFGLKNNTAVTTDVNFVRDVSGASVIRTDGLSWASAGFGVGQDVTISGSSPDNGTYTVASVNGSTMKLTANVSTATQVTTTVDFAVVVNGSNTSYQITRTDGVNWGTGTNFVGGKTIVVTGAGVNNGTYTISSVGGTGGKTLTVTLIAGGTVITTANGVSNVTLSSAVSTTFDENQLVLTPTKDGVNTSLIYSGNTITRTDGFGWGDTSIQAGSVINVSGTKDAASSATNDGTYTVTAVSGSAITVAGPAFARNVTVVSTVIEPRAGDVTTNLTFAQSGSGDTITRTDGKAWSTSFTQGATITVSGTARTVGGNTVSDDGSYVIASVSGSVLTITATNKLAVATIGIAGTVLSQHDAGADVHTFTRAGDGAFGGLVDGSTYTVHVLDAAAGTFQLGAPGGTFTPITITIPAGASSALHSLTPIIDLQASGGTHELRIDITGSTVPGTQRIVGPGGVSLATLSPPPGDGVSTALATGSGGGFVGSNNNTSNATITATVTAYIAAASLSATGDVAVAADSLTNARATTSNSTGGFVGIGKTFATTNQSSTTEAYIGADSSIGAGGDVSVRATSLHITDGSSSGECRRFRGRRARQHELDPVLQHHGRPAQRRQDRRGWRCRREHRRQYTGLGPLLRRWTRLRWRWLCEHVAVDQSDQPEPGRDRRERDRDRTHGRVAGHDQPDEPVRRGPGLRRRLLGRVRQLFECDGQCAQQGADRRRREHHRV